MIGIKKGVRAEEVRQSAKHILFVEGANDTSFDRIVLSELFEGMIDIKPLGPSFHIRSAAEALYKHHPNYYFIIDRDHYNDERVANSWNRFPDPNTNNLLIWRRRELENYFLIPEYLLRSKWCDVSPEKLTETILKKAQERLFMDAANRVIVSIREDLKENWIELFSDVGQFSSKEKSLSLLLEKKEFETCCGKVSIQTHKKFLKETYEIILSQLTGNNFPLEYGVGTWLEQLCGKEIFRIVANQCFKVLDSNNRQIQGQIKFNEIAKDLLKQPLTDQPDDFQELHRLIIQRINSF